MAYREVTGMDIDQVIPLDGGREDSGYRTIDRYGPEHGTTDRAFRGVLAFSRHQS